MPFLIGTDEAGYGPNLGPLTVTGVSWEVGDCELDLYEVLQKVVCDKPARAARAKSKAKSPVPQLSPLLVADSKIVYKSSGGIATLETNVLSFLAALHGRVPSNLLQLMNMLNPAQPTGVSLESETTSEREIWAQQLSLPLTADSVTIGENAARLSEEFESKSIVLRGIECAAVFPNDFNLRLDQYGNKASLLSAQTLQIVQRLKQQALPVGGDMKIVCDKHGGRSKYFALLQQYVTESLVQIDHESLEISSYRWTENAQSVEAHFVARGESFLATALASMFSKYVRELYMHVWNEFWQLKIPGLKSTKGYPQDAKRFKREIQTVQANLGIRDDVIWRQK